MIYQQYQDQIKTSTEEIQQLNKLINNNSFARLFVIIGGGALLFYSFQWNNVPLVLLLMIGIVLLFVFLIRRQSRLEQKRADAIAFLSVNENELAVKNTRHNMYDGGQEFEDNLHPYTSDLDVFGDFSLFARINRAATQLGKATLAQWLKSAAHKSVIEQRQQATAEMADDVVWSQQFQAKLVFNLSQKIEMKSFLARYFQDAGLSFGGTLLKRYVTIVPYIMLALILVSVFTVPLWPYVGTLALFHLLWTLRMGGKVSLFSSKIDKVGKVLAAYAEGLALVEKKSFKSSLTIGLQEKLRVKDTRLSDAFKQLSSLIDNLDARNNMLVGALLNMFLLWDFKYVMKIVQWKGKYEANILVAFDVIAEFEALNALAILKRNEPAWTMPKILDQSTGAITCRHIAHPLIAANNSVANDYSNAEHHIALITGSNMAGKSTFLRTVGINAVLAYAGAVCCATSLSLPICHLISYMRIKDSLNESTSTFKAELDRMRFILDTVGQDPHSFFLIDEMLRGTNSVDKYLGSRAIIQKLISMQGKGMVATHDLQLATLEEEYAGKVQNYHFDIQVSEGEMLFDYKLKHGRCTIFNASMLLKGIGIDVEQA
ncbi:MutS-related protein [Sphingobacterium griseoflavum]|uniref:DNA mismatch repair protein MutS n=1 Tax=Sphingobacterium griseoflavum TaxID=1474952 RepID=A0ABQ3I0H7_9SPHI|nr:DNA mismatch repair protein MutS [Sphingobacterium griseoflavum]GHE46030.1 DNA mismatch repair protein MutS [Sphingobacterium griseoflavum]